MKKFISFTLICLVSLLLITGCNIKQNNNGSLINENNNPINENDNYDENKDIGLSKDEFLYYLDKYSLFSPGYGMGSFVGYDAKKNTYYEFESGEENDFEGNVLSVTYQKKNKYLAMKCLSIVSEMFTYMDKNANDTEMELYFRLYELSEGEMLDGIN